MQSEQSQSQQHRRSCIINVAFDGYEQDRQGLIASLDKFAPDVHRVFANSPVEVQAPSHIIDHYAFKPYAFRAVEDKYDLVLWMDARIRVLKSLSFIWDILDDEGYFFLAHGQWIGEWSSDECLEAFTLSRERALIMPELSACVLGLNLKKSIPAQFLNDWQLAAVNGHFRGDWHNDQHQVSMDDRVRGHRHDQTCASIIAHRLGMTNFRPGLLWYYKEGQSPPDSAVFVNGGP